ncbi:MAG: alpha-E domain-containing protein, partial [Polyangiaceae bacterium]|nr:alpha-E domain-containing protein [Polyangiaceae bacterium]
MLSRAADALYWMCRYAERAENVARFLDVSLQVMLDLPGDTHGDPWAGILAATGDEEIFAARYGRATRDSVVHFLTVDAESPNSIVSCVRLARDNARSIREAISSETW